MSKKILVVDDDPVVVRLLAMTLADAGYDVALARNGQEGYTTAMSLKPHAIVSDVDMPFEDGGSMAARLKENQDTSSTPVIFLTGLLPVGEVPKNHGMEGRYYLAKPFNLQVLVQLVEQVLRDHPSLSL